MSEKQLRALIAAILLGADTIARAAISPHGHANASPLTDARAVAAAKNLIEQAYR